MKTYLGTKYDYDFLRAWIKNPFTLEKHEDKAMREFIESHGVEVEKSDFGWFFATYYDRNVQFAQSEINCLIKLVDEMEKQPYCLICGKIEPLKENGARLTAITRKVKLCSFPCEMHFYRKNPINIEIRTGFSLIKGTREKSQDAQYHNFRNNQAEIVFNWQGEEPNFLSISLYQMRAVTHNCYSHTKMELKPIDKT